MCSIRWWRYPIARSWTVRSPGAPRIVRLGRHAFYVRAKAAFAVVMTGDTAKHGNILLTKGVSPMRMALFRDL